MAKHSIKDNKYAKYCKYVFVAATAITTSITGVSSLQHHTSFLNTMSSVSSPSSVSSYSADSGDTNATVVSRDFYRDSLYYSKFNTLFRKLDEAKHAFSKDAKFYAAWSKLGSMKSNYSHSDDENKVLSDLKTALDNGLQMLTDSDGKVLDNAVRDNLKSKLDAIQKYYENSSTSMFNINDCVKQSEDLKNATNAVQQSMNDKAAQQAKQRSNNITVNIPPAGTMQRWLHDDLIRQGFSEQDYQAANWIISRESGWRVNATNASSGAYGLPQALPGGKMASFGADWRTNYQTQLKWFENYCVNRYGGFVQAQQAWVSKGWY